MRKFLIPLWLAMVATVLTGCGGGGGGDSGGTISPASITTQPVPITVYETQTATFSVYASGSNLTYQWRRNGTNITGATSPSYTTPATALSDSGASYTVSVTGTTGSPTSTAAALTVRSGTPVIASQPTNQSVIAGQPASFSVTATGLPPFSYQWTKGSAPITGATTAYYTTPAAASGDSGSQYSVTVTNGMGTVASTTASLTVVAPVVNHLVISEVASCYYSNVNCWFEIHNAYGVCSRSECLPDQIHWPDC